ncbi:hypothetical protein J31TS6_24720 [Brevibacillus reuszeri]|nr:hypothetical protein [Brevibacillus reuszeri]GIO06444.1 hypothetical protein J31TS6_24720 [Brevibacillus reuszeri]
MAFVITANCIEEKAGEFVCTVSAIFWDGELRDDEKIYLEYAIKHFKGR